jgi:hypothetical protein
MKNLILALGLCSVASHAMGQNADQPVQWIDTQAQFQPGEMPARFAEALPRIIADMDAHGVSQTFLVPPPTPPAYMLPKMPPMFRYDIRELKAAADRHPGRFKVVGGGEILNSMIHATSPDRVSESDKAKFRKLADEILALGSLGFGEVTSSHYALPGMFQNHPYESTAPDHPLLLLLADLAAEKDVPIDIHFDGVPADMPLPEHLRAAPSNPRELKANLPAFERFLAHNRKARIIWSHVGSDPGRQRPPQRTREMLERHPNLFMSIRVVALSPVAGAPLDEAGTLREEWVKLLSDHKERFILHTDRFYRLGEPLVMYGSKDGFALTRKLLDQLPAEVAKAIAYENVRRIYRLPD